MHSARKWPGGGKGESLISELKSQVVNRGVELDLAGVT